MIIWIIFMIILVGGYAYVSYWLLSEIFKDSRSDWNQRYERLKKELKKR